MIKQPQESYPPGPYAEVIAQLTLLIETEMARLGVPSLGVALVDDQEIIWEAGFGPEKADGDTRVSKNSVFRVGSISKVVTAAAIAQAANQGLVDLDAPVSQYLPELVFEDPYKSEQTITLRHLLSHRAGIIREAPVGHFMDSSEPGIEETVGSMIGSRLINPVGASTKYSNLGATIAGLILEKVTGIPFAEYMKKQIFEPTGMTLSSFLKESDELCNNLVDAFMVDFDGELFPAPGFNFGTSPAGNLYSTAGDLARFIRMFFLGGKTGDKQIIKSETVDEMMRIQFPKEADDPMAFGLGFMVGELEARTKVGHGGMVYGFASLFEALPDEKLAVIILNNRDATFGLNTKVSSQALRLMLNAKLDAGMELIPELLDNPELEPAEYVGKYMFKNRPAFVTIDKESLVLELEGRTSLIRAMPDGTFITDGQVSYGVKVAFHQGDERTITGFENDGNVYTKVDGYVSNHSVPQHWKHLVGDYGAPYSILRIFILDGQLWCQVERILRYPMTEINEDLFAFPDYGAYSGEEICFKRDAEGKIDSADMASVYFTRM